MDERGPRLVRVLVNPRSGLPSFFGSLRRAIDAYWDLPGVQLTYQFSQSAEDGKGKATRAVEEGVDTILVVGGDGTINTIGTALIGTDVSLGAIPAGSGNGFARHFGIPLSPEKAVWALANASVKRIDVGMADGKPFFVTCSMAWDAAIVRSFMKSPIRGVVPYVFAGVQELFDYEPQDMRVRIDGEKPEIFPSPLVLTVANLSQYGGGGRIAPQAEADDGFLELVIALRQDVPRLIANIGRFFAGTFNEVPGVITKRFRSLVVNRPRPAPIQLDGELLNTEGDVSVDVMPAALNVLVPDSA